MKKPTKPRITIARLTKKQLRKTKENHSYYLLHLTLHPNLIRLYFQLTGKKSPTLKTNSALYLFPEKNQWGSKLKVADTYLFHYQKQNSYFHLTDWKRLGDQATIKRAWQLLTKIRECDKS